MATQIPGAPAEGTPYDPGVPATSEATGSPPQAGYDPAALNNFTSSTLESDQEIGFPDNCLICDRSGFKLPVSQGLVETWDGLKVRKASYEPRQPLDFIRTKSESDQAGSSRPEQEDIFLSTNEVSVTDL